MKLFMLAILTGHSLFAQIVALDGFHNDETKTPDHYRWETTKPGGYSELGKVIQSLGGKLKTIHERLTPQVLVGIKVFIIADPDTPAESDNPKYLEQSEIDALDQWVHDGGRLVLLGNNKGNAEFEHFNRLAARFGIEFLEETYPKVAGKGILVARGTGSIFDGGLTVYLIEIAPLRITGNAHILLEDKGTPIMALADVGKGKVFALGDPWVYKRIHWPGRQSASCRQSVPPAVAIKAAALLQSWHHAQPPQIHTKHRCPKRSTRPRAFRNSHGDARPSISFG